MTELAKTLEGLVETLVQEIAERQKKEPAIPWFVHAREIARTGQLVPAQAEPECLLCANECRGHPLGDVEAWKPEPGSWAYTADAMTSAKDAEIAEARRQALEEAAKACEAHRYGDSLSDSCTLRKEHRQDIAKAIRALAERKEAP